eukprot:gene4575-5849_t
MPENFRHWSPLPVGVTWTSYDLAELLPMVVEADLFQATSAPDAFLHEEPAYATLNRGVSNQVCGVVSYVELGRIPPNLNPVISAPTSPPPQPSRVLRLGRQENDNLSNFRGDFSLNSIEKCADNLLTHCIEMPHPSNQVFVSRRAGLFTLRMGVATTHEGVEGLTRMDVFKDIDFVFDATSAGAHVKNDAFLRSIKPGIRLIDLTPAAWRPSAPAKRRWPTRSTRPSA